MPCLYRIVIVYSHILIDSSVFIHYNDINIIAYGTI